MAMRGGMYSANKRRKELQRKKKQEEKRQKRQKTAKDDLTAPEGTGQGGDVPETSGDAPEAADN